MKTSGRIPYNPVGRYDVNGCAHYPDITHVIVQGDIWLPHRVATFQAVHITKFGANRPRRDPKIAIRQLSLPIYRSLVGLKLNG